MAESLLVPGKLGCQKIVIAKAPMSVAYKFDVSHSMRLRKHRDEANVDLLKKSEKNS